MASFDTLLRVQPAPEDRNVAVDRSDIDSMMRRIFETARVDENAPEAGNSIEPKASAPRRDFDTAFELLDRVSKTFELLVTRFQRMQTELDGQAERAAARNAEQDQTIEKYERLALSLKRQIETADAALVDLRAKCDSAEARADVAEKQVAALEAASHLAADQALQAERLTTKLHDKVVTVFGIGSRAHAVLEAVATRAAD